MADRTVKVRLEAVIGQYEAAMAKAGISTKSLGHTIDSIASGSDRSWKSMALGLKGIGTESLIAGAAVAVAGVALTKLARDGVESYIELVDQVKAYKNVTGASAEESSKMVAVARVLGVGVDTVANGMFRLSRQVNSNRDALAADGVVIAKTKTGQVDLTATLANVAEAYQRAGAGAAGNTILFDAFGRSGRSMIPILKQDREHLEEFWNAAEKHHQIVGDADLEAVFKYKVAVRELHESVQGLEREAAPGTVSWLTKGANLARKGVEGLPSFWHQFTHDTQAGQAIAGFGAVLDHLSGSHDKGSDAAHKQAEAEQHLADDLAADAQKAKDFSDALDGLYASSFSVSEAQGKFTSDLAAFADKVRAAQLAGDAYASSLDESTLTGRENAEMVRGLAKDIIDTAKAAQSMGEDTDAATAVQREALRKVLEQLGFTKAEAQHYLDVLMKIPGLVQTTVDVDTTAAERKVQELKNQFDFLNPIPGAGATPPAVTDALAGEGPEAKAERERQQQEAEQRKRDAEQAARDAAQRQRDAEQAARDRQRQQDQMMANRFEFGGISAEAYKAYLNQRLAQTVQFSDEWADIWHKIDQVNQEIGAGWEAAKAQIKASEDEWMRVLRVQHEIGELSTADYIKQLEKRLTALAKYSDEWFSVWQEIQQLKDEASQNVLDIIAAVEKQRQFDIGFYGAAEQRTLQAERSASVLVQAGSTTTRTYSPTFNVTTADPNTYSANQKMRDDAFLAGV